MITEQEIDNFAKIVWDYHHMNQPLKKADTILAIGSFDTRVADRAAELYFQGLAPVIIFSGNTGALAERVFDKPEAEVFAEIAMKLGVPEDKIILEKESTNTGENIQLTRELLEARGLNFKSFILMTKPYMERRAYATFKKQWEGVDFVVTSPQIEYEKYFNEGNPKNYVLNFMVGDLQRIKEYANRGFQIPQEIPANVWEAYEQLVALGFTDRLIRH